MPQALGEPRGRLWSAVYTNFSGGLDQMPTKGLGDLQLLLNPLGQGLDIQGLG